MRRVGLIGAGQIGKPVLDFLQATADWTLVCVLVRTERCAGDVATTTDGDVFFANDMDLIIDAAGPAALRCHGERALARADLWTVGGSALSDPDLSRRLCAAGQRAGRRLRVLPGAIGGVDMVATMAVDPSLQLHIDIERPGLAETSTTVFSGSVGEGTARFADDLNVAAAASLAGLGLDATSVTLRSTPKEGRHRLSLSVNSRYGHAAASFEVSADALSVGHHPVAACIIAALLRETQTIWVG